MKMKRIIPIVLVVVMVFAFAASSFALTVNYTNKRIYGGPSQELSVGTRNRLDNTYLYVSSIKNMKSGWKFRAYNRDNGLSCSSLIEITGIGYWYSNYTSLPNMVKVMTSISSTASGDYLDFTGTLHY